MREWTTTEWHQFCKNLALAWNSEAKEAGWPERLDPEELSKKRRMKTKSAAAWNQEGCPDAAALGWILRRWNWDRSPAPTELATSKNQWNAWRAWKQAIEEEALEERKQREQQRRKEARASMTRMKKSGFCQEEAIKRTLEIARGSGNWRAWSPQEKLAFYEELEKEEKE